MSVLLHGVAMHLPEDDFCRLVHGEADLQPIEELGGRQRRPCWMGERDANARSAPSAGSESMIQVKNPYPTPN
jgi:hypothetical protein